MKLAVLLSGGKDSLYAAYLAESVHQLACAVTIQSSNAESYMFHTPNISLVKEQAEAMQLPLVIQKTLGEKEEELNDLKIALQEAQQRFGIQGVVTGAVASQYQASRVQQICYDLGLFCYNPLWQLDQLQLLRQLLEHQFTVRIVGVYAYPFDDSLLGVEITPQTITLLEDMQERFQINPAGEGGELETFVTDCPLFHKKITIKQATTKMDSPHSGIYDIQAVVLEPKSSARKPTPPVLTYPSQQKNAAVTIVSCVDVKQPLLEQEFLRPLVEECKKLNLSVAHCHISQLDESIAGQRFILSGTALADNDFLTYKKNVISLLKKEKPVLGICAGAQLMGLAFGATLQPILEIGPHHVERVKPQAFFSKETYNNQEFFLHQFGFPIQSHRALNPLLVTSKGLGAFKIQTKPFFGVQFHPELNDRKLLRAFLTYSF